MLAQSLPKEVLFFGLIVFVSLILFSFYLKTVYFFFATILNGHYISVLEKQINDKLNKDYLLWWQIIVPYYMEIRPFRKGFLIISPNIFLGSFILFLYIVIFMLLLGMAIIIFNSNNPHIFKFFNYDFNALQTIKVLLFGLIIFVILYTPSVFLSGSEHGKKFIFDKAGIHYERLNFNFKIILIKFINNLIYYFKIKTRKLTTKLRLIYRKNIENK